MKKKKVLMDLSPDIYRKFKSAVILNGTTVRQTIEEFMKDYVRRNNGSRIKDSGVR